MSKRTKFLLGIGVIAALVLGLQIAAFAGTRRRRSGFQDDDGNLDSRYPNRQGTLDWNSFAPSNWTPAPPRTGPPT